MVIKIYMDTYHRIWSSFLAVPPEAGGILGCRENGIISDFFYDIGTPDTSAAIYTPNISVLNDVIEGWALQGIRFCGMIHSHPFGNEMLSGCDKEYIVAIRSSVNRDCEPLYFPIIIPMHKLVSYVIEETSKGLMFVKVPVEIIASEG